MALLATALLPCHSSGSGALAAAAPLGNGRFHTTAQGITPRELARLLLRSLLLQGLGLSLRLQLQFPMRPLGARGAHWTGPPGRNSKADLDLALAFRPLAPTSF
jgi:hypothetical protein